MNLMKQEVLFLLLNEYADWEGAFLAISLNTGVIPGSEVKYVPVSYTHLRAHET